MAGQIDLHSDVEAPRSRCFRGSNSDAERADRVALVALAEQRDRAERAARRRAGLGDPSCGLTFTLILLTCAAFVYYDWSWGKQRWWDLVPFLLFLRHRGPLHLASNVFALYQFGSLVEPAVGKARMLAAYVLSGAAGCLAGGTYLHLAWRTPGWRAWLAQAARCVQDGAPVAVLGVGGVLLALNRPTIWTPFGVRKSRDIRVALWANVAANVLFCESIEAMLPYSPFRSTRRAGYVGHAGGLLAGAALGCFL